MNPWRRLPRYCKRVHAMWVFLLCVGLLVCVLTQVARVTNPSIRSSLLEVSINQHKSTLIVGRWQFASAHSNVAIVSEYRQRRLAIKECALLLMAQSTSSALGFILPLLAIFAGLALTRSTQGSCEPSLITPRHTVLWMGVLCFSIPLVIGVFLVIESHILRIPHVWATWSRILVWMGCVGTYFAGFLFFGSWISRLTQHTKMAAWIFLSLFVAFFVIQGSRELAMRVDGSALPPVPELPAEVRLSLFRPSGEPRVTSDREEMVADYLAAVDSYSESLHALASRQYMLERWWHVVSPQLLLSEISLQVLQSQFADVVDVAFSAGHEDQEASLMASLASVWLELVWLVLICCFTWMGHWLTSRKQAIVR